MYLDALSRRLSLLVLVLFSTPVAAPASSPVVQPAPRAIMLRSGTVAVDDAPGRLHDACERRPAPSRLWTTRRFLAHFRGEPARVRARLEARGLEVVAYIPWDTFLVTVPRGMTGRCAIASGLLEVDAILPYRPALRMAPEVSALGPGSEEVRGVLHLFPDADVNRVRARLEALGVAPTLGAGPRFIRAGFRTTASHLVQIRDRLVEMDDVFWVALQGEVRLLNDTAVPIVQSGTPDGTPLVAEHGLDGRNQIIAVLDTGLDIDSCYFRDDVHPPAINLDFGTATEVEARKVVAYDFLYALEDPADPRAYDTLGHGTHVAGNAAGDDLANPLVRDSNDGMALGAKLVVQDGGYALDDCADLPALGGPVLDLTPFLEQAYDQGARTHSDSWGDNENAAVHNTYSAATEDVDAFVWSHPDMVVIFAAGNSGPFSGSVGSPSTCKNGLSVGGTWNDAGMNVVYLVSGRGPAADGRIKPDVMAPANTRSAGGDLDITTDNCTQDHGSGTSFSTPLVAGAAAMVRQYFVDGYYPRGEPSPEDGFDPSAALVKAVLINSSINMTATSPIPSDDQGWGRVALDRALAFAGGDFVLRVVDEEVWFTASDSAPYRLGITVDDSSVPLKVSLVWTDPPSTPASALNLVNDLDLEVTCGARTWLGNVFRGGKSATGGQPDRLNNVEQVLLPLPRAGACTVEVRPVRIVEAPQTFALVVRGAFH